MSDFAKRELGVNSSMALDGLELSIWKRSTETMREAEAALEAGSLTPERAMAILIALVEQHKLVKTLRNQVEEGLRAAVRISRRSVEVEVAADRARDRRLNGGNRFMRSRVGQVPPADAAS